MGFLNSKYEFYMITIQYQVNYWLFLKTDHFCTAYRYLTEYSIKNE